jgi:hypothetical protein
LIAPYGSEEAPPNIPAPAVPLSEIGVERWQYDLWFQIVRAVLDGHPEQVDLTYQRRNSIHCDQSRPILRRARKPPLTPLIGKRESQFPPIN